MKKFSIATLISSILLTSCAAKTGHAFLEKMSDKDISVKLVKNSTTKEEVQKLFGDPEDVKLHKDGTETWQYKFVRSEAKGVNFVPIVSSFYAGTNDSIKRLKILFNANGTVSRFAFSNSKGETKAGLLQ